LVTVLVTLRKDMSLIEWSGCFDPFLLNVIRRDLVWVTVAVGIISQVLVPESYQARWTINIALLFVEKTVRGFDGIAKTNGTLDRDRFRLNPSRSISCV